MLKSPNRCKHQDIQVNKSTGVCIGALISPLSSAFMWLCLLHKRNVGSTKHYKHTWVQSKKDQGKLFSHNTDFYGYQVIIPTMSFKLSSHSQKNDRRPVTENCSAKTSGSVSVARMSRYTSCLGPVVESGHPHSYFTHLSREGSLYTQQGGSHSSWAYQRAARGPGHVWDATARPEISLFQASSLSPLTVNTHWL